MTAEGATPTGPSPQGAHCRGAPYPIVLGHGFAGFERIGPVHYFFGVAEDLRARGHVVYEAEVDPYAPVAVRGAELAAIWQAIRRETGACKLNVLAHSQGGLDARYAISALGEGGGVAAVVTISTPHRGTPLADVVLGLVPGFSYATINAVLQAVQGLTEGAMGAADLKKSLGSLATADMAAWSAAHPDDPRVAYFSVAGRSGGRRADELCAGGLWNNPTRVDLVDPLLVLPESIIAATGPFLQPVVNDGIVPTASARWGTFLGCVPADHFDEVGQIGDLAADPISGFDHRDLYRRLADLLRARGD